MFVKRLAGLVTEFRQMPRVAIDLQRPAANDNDPFFGRIVDQFYREARRRHPRALLLRKMSHGVALCQLPQKFDEYFMRIEAAARRNYKKAVREGCRFQRIQFNDHLDAIREIRQSSRVRQGRLMPESYLNGELTPCTDPPSRNHLHDYPYFGVVLNGKLVAYSACIIAGEVCMIEHILGHAEYLEQNVVPFMIIEIAKSLYSDRPAVKYYGYGTYFGAGETLRRFKRKFGFQPHRVDWRLDGSPATQLGVANNPSMQP